MIPAVEYLEIVGWSDHLHPDVSRKVKPPYRWVKLETENLDCLGDLSLRDYGAFCRLLGLAALTNNRTVYNPAVIRRRTGVTKGELKRLENRGLIRIVTETNDFENSQQKQLADSISASSSSANLPQAAGPEGKGLEGKGSDMRGIESPTLSPPPLPAIPNQARSPDLRSFDQLKSEVLAAGRKLNTADHRTIFNSARQTLGMSSRQVEECVRQLIEDNEL